MNEANELFLGRLLLRDFHFSSRNAEGVFGFFLGRGIIVFQSILAFVGRFLRLRFISGSFRLRVS